MPIGFINAIDILTKRSNLDYYRKILEEVMEDTCFYCGRKFRRLRVEVDHVIPWSYIHNDNLWNLVLACRECNNNKRDSLPHRKYIDILICRNNHWQKNCLKLEKEMLAYNSRNIEGLYTYAENNGFTVGWLPKEYNLG